jgi:hypothetical protein
MGSHYYPAPDTLHKLHQRTSPCTAGFFPNWGNRVVSVETERILAACITLSTDHRRRIRGLLYLIEDEFDGTSPIEDEFEGHNPEKHLHNPKIPKPVSAFPLLLVRKQGFQLSQDVNRGCVFFFVKKAPTL